MPYKTLTPGSLLGEIPPNGPRDLPGPEAGVRVAYLEVHHARIS